MMKTRSLGKIFGVEVKLHGTFLLLLAFVALSGLFRGGPIQAGLSVALSVIIFGVVVLHEFGHILTARRFGIRTKDVILSPLGGMARLEKLPTSPGQEIAVALAGPAVNLVLAGLGALLLYSPLWAQSGPVGLFLGALTSWFVTINLVLLGFNLIPALPMDGGRVLRAALTIKYGYLKATQKAARVARWSALLMALYALYSGQFMLLFIAGFVFVMSWMELVQASVRQTQQNPIFQIFRGFQQSQGGQAHGGSQGYSQVVDQDGNPVSNGGYRVRSVRWVDEA